MKIIFFVSNGSRMVAYVYEREESKEKIIVFKTDYISVDSNLIFYNAGNFTELENRGENLEWFFGILRDFQNGFENAIKGK